MLFRSSCALGFSDVCGSLDHGRTVPNEDPRAQDDATTIAYAYLPRTTAQGALPTNFIVRCQDRPGTPDCDNPDEISRVVGRSVAHRMPVHDE